MSNKSGKFGKRKGDGYERELAKYLDQKLFGSTGQISRMPLSGGGSHLGVGVEPTCWELRLSGSKQNAQKNSAHMLLWLKLKMV